MTRSAANLLPLLSVALSACVLAGAASAKTSDRNQTMNLDSDSVDCSNDVSAPCVFKGNVHIVQGTLNITSARADVQRANGEPKSVKLTGSPVKMKQQSDDGGWMNAAAAQIDYDMPNDIIVLTGNANVDQPGRGNITGGRIVYNTKSGQVQSGGEAGGGRVNMKFEPKNKTPASAPPAPAQDDT